MTKFNPSNLTAFTKSLTVCYLGDAPALVTVGQAFGENVINSWLVIQFADISEYAGCTNKLTPAQNQTLSAVIMQEFGYLKVTELMHFFQLFKGGKYGRFYGSVDPMVITCALREYQRDRLDIIAKLERERKQAEEAAEKARHAEQMAAFRARLKSEGITLEEWVNRQKQEIFGVKSE